MLFSQQLAEILRVEEAKEVKLRGEGVEGMNSHLLKTHSSVTPSEIKQHATLYPCELSGACWRINWLLSVLNTTIQKPSKHF